MELFSSQSVSLIFVATILKQVPIISLRIFSTVFNLVCALKSGRFNPAEDSKKKERQQ